MICCPETCGSRYNRGVVQYDIVEYDVVIVGGGILGVSVSYYMGCLNPGAHIAVIERETGVARHTSGRNTGKVHAPYLYDPHKKRLFARSALIGYDMWREYAAEHDLPFKRDGVLEVATESGHNKVLDKYYRWGNRNGLDESDMVMLDSRQVSNMEPEVRCHGALLCKRDAAVNYRVMTESLKRESQNAGVTFLLGQNATHVNSVSGHIHVRVNGAKTVRAKFLINTAGGQAVDVAHRMGVAKEYTDVHFRGEYWRAPPEYYSLTNTSIYSVPRYGDYPFLDPHWIRRVDDTCEVGPNAVPVFSPYGYGAAENARQLLPKLLEMLSSGARMTLLDARFQSMAISEVNSAVSKHAMISRVRRFLPRLRPERFRYRGTAGIRSSLIDRRGSFVPDVIIREGADSLHILNYNSPGATGALPFAAHIAHMIHSKGLYRNKLDDAQCGIWRFAHVIDSLNI